MAEKSLKEQFVVGIVRGSHGITGEFKVESTSGVFEHFFDMKEVTLTNDVVSKVFRVEYVKDGGNTLYMKLAGIDTPEKAAEFNRYQIVVPRDKAHKLQKNEWYFEDLKGCSLWYEDVAGSTAPAKGEKPVVGTVTNVLEGGSGYLVEIELSESLDKSGKKVFVPFNKEFIGEVDVEKGLIQLMHLWILE